MRFAGYALALPLAILVMGAGRAPTLIGHSSNDWHHYSAGLVSPLGIALDPNGEFIWVADPGAEQLVRLTIATGTITAVPISVAGATFVPNELTFGPPGRTLYVTGAPQGGTQEVALVNPTTGTGRAYSSTDDAPVGKLTVGPDHLVWFPESTHIASINKHGKITEYSYGEPSCVNGYSAVTVGPDKNIWFTESFANYLCGTAFGTIDLATHAVRQFDTSVSYGCGTLNGIAPGGDGRLYSICAVYSSYAGPVLACSTDGNIGVYHGYKLGVAGDDVAEAPDGNVLFEPDNVGKLAFGRFNVTTHAVDLLKSGIRGTFMNAMVVDSSHSRVWSTVAPNIYYLTYP